MVPGRGSDVGRAARAATPFVEVTAAVVLAVTGVAVGSARADAPLSTTIATG